MLCTGNFSIAHSVQQRDLYVMILTIYAFIFVLISCITFICAQYKGLPNIQDQYLGAKEHLKDNHPIYDFQKRGFLRGHEVDKNLIYNTEGFYHKETQCSKRGKGGKDKNDKKDKSGRWHHGQHVVSRRYDVIIMSGPSPGQANRTRLCIESLLKYVAPIRHIYVISPDNYLDLPLLNSSLEKLCTGEAHQRSNDTTSHYPVHAHSIVFVSDAEFMQMMKEKFHYEPSYESMWHVQQLMKLHAPLILPNILDTVLVMDAEIIFHKRLTHTMLNNGEIIGLYTFGRGLSDRRNNHYWEFVKSLVPGAKRTIVETSMIAHHMLIQKDILLEMMEHIEERHQKIFWKAFLDEGNSRGHRASEYELYIRFSLFRYPEKTYMRLIPYFDVGNCSYTDAYVYYTSCHGHLIEMNISIDEQ